MAQRENSQTMLMKERQRRILDAVRAQSKVLVSELSETLGVTPATIRTDLRYLESLGQLERTHGGAVLPAPSSTVEVAIGTRMSVNRKQKMRIAAEAARLVNDGDFLLIDSGSTARSFALALSGHTNLTILTNDVIIANIAETKLDDVTVIMIGGIIRNKQNHTQGSVAIDMLRHYYSPKLFLSTDAFVPEMGFSTFETEQATVKRTMLEQSGKHILLTDSSKFGVTAPVPYAQLRDIDILITDTGISEGMRDVILRSEDAPELRIV